MAELEGRPGFAMTQEERIAQLVAMVGGPVKAAAIIGKTRTHIDNMRKPNAPLRLDDALALAREAGVTLDWVATGHHVRPDLAEQPRHDGELSEAGAGKFGALPGFTQLLPLRPETVTAGGRSVERWTPSDIAVSAQWLNNSLGLTAETARYAEAGDGGMAPLIGKGSLLIVDTRPANPRTGLYLVGVGDELLPRRLSRLPDGSADLIADADPRWHYALPAAAERGPELYRIAWAGQPL